MQLRHLHRASALVLIAFAFIHVGNHLLALKGVPTHLAVMNGLRSVYRLPAVEVVLMGCVIVQVASGLALVLRGWKKRTGRVAWLQALSGAYLAAFLVIHVAAVLYGRSALGLDTNFYFAAAGLHVSPYQWFFGPYYALAVFALFAHLSCACYWLARDTAPVVAKHSLTIGVALGVLTSALITLSLAGSLQPVQIPAEYKATYGKQ